MSGGWRKVEEVLRTVGPGGTVAWYLERLVMRVAGWKDPRRGTFMLLPRGSQGPVFVRRNSTDLGSFDQVFVQREYACLDDLSSPGLVVDCGANVGYSSVWFLERFPGCRVVAIEPDEGNFRILGRNTARFGDRIKLIQAGVWPEPAKLKIDESTQLPRFEWGLRVRTCQPGEPSCLTGITIDQILEIAGEDRISLLKMDIEGSEAEVFARNYRSWLDRVDNIAIELHDNTGFGPASEIFMRAIEGRGFAVTRSGELTICRSAPPARPP